VTTSDPSRVDPTDPDERALRRYAGDLADGIDAALAGWVVSSVVTRTTAAGRAVDASMMAEAEAAGEQCRVVVGARTRALLALDIDAQPTTPLTLIRGAVSHAAGVLAAHGVPEPRRDDFAVTTFPDDVYDLAPATFDDVSPDLHDPGLRWGAAKAHVHLKRRRAAGQR